MLYCRDLVHIDFFVYYLPGILTTSQWKNLIGPEHKFEIRYGILFEIEFYAFWATKISKQKGNPLKKLQKVLPINQ
jgi:hypothetical protein